MNIDLNKKLYKVWSESERSVDPYTTLKKVNSATKRIGIQLEINSTNHSNLFWISFLNNDLTTLLPPGVKPFKVAGKGQSEKQSLVSCAMEFIERWSWYTYLNREKKDHRCLDLHEKKTYIINPGREIYNTMCISSGNNYEEAILHSLHELIETRISKSCYWKPYKVVPMESLFPEFPLWVKNNIILVQTPSDIKEFYHFTALKYPINNKFDIHFSDQIVKSGDHLFFKSTIAPKSYHSPNSGGAAGLNPYLAAFRAINEIFQTESFEIIQNNEKRLPDFIQILDKSEIINYETNSITDDIKLILKLIGHDVFIGIIDLTDPILNIPVIKLISNYNPNKSLVSKETMNLFFEL